MIQALDTLKTAAGQRVGPELPRLVAELLGGASATGRLVGQDTLSPRALRLRFQVDGRARTLIAKRLTPEIGGRNQRLIERWLPAVGLDHCAPGLLGVASDVSGQLVWHVYEELGGDGLSAVPLDEARLREVVGLIAQVHVRFAEHPLLGECRLHGGDLGIGFYQSSLRDALRSLEALGPPRVTLTAEREGVRGRLLEWLRALRDEALHWDRALREHGGPETLLHGDLCPRNILVSAPGDGGRAALIDWDHAAVGPVSYDLSCLLSYLPPGWRRVVLDLYREEVRGAGWSLPAAPELDLLFRAAECARVANACIWPALSALDGALDWGFDRLAGLERRLRRGAHEVPDRQWG